MVTQKGSQIHQDTTTVTFSGKYAGWSASELLGYGINKDHRPDLKQLVLGLSVTADGSVPLVHKIYDGNQTDDRLHPENHQRLRQRLKRTDFIYVADCQLATEENLRRIAGCGGRFVSVMPRTWKFQAFLEKRHSQLKTWQQVAPVLLKKGEPVVGYLHMHVMALMVATLIERELRKAMKRRGLSALPLSPEDRTCPYPTMFDIVRAFRGVERYEVIHAETITLFPASLTPLQKQLLEMLDVPISLYQ